MILVSIRLLQRDRVVNRPDRRPVLRPHRPADQNRGENAERRKQYSKDMFVLVPENERLLDKKFKTKQLTYFQDAMPRFTKNKNNVVATAILAVFILLSIFVPIITPRNLYTRTNSSLTTLPPRIPLLEKLGIMDGTKEFRNRPIDYTTIDPETGLGYPTIGFQSDYLDFDSSLINEYVVGVDRSPHSRGGTNELFVDTERSAYSIVTPTARLFRRLIKSK
ncbi:MAG: hypothetical protein MZU79_01470 [Anaerotruncus sp.]|nr:hypothetical protein [Anaerotruncus sp.]